MTTQNLTPWYPPHIKPVRVGVYRVRAQDYTNPDVWMYSYWDGNIWMRPSTKPNWAEDESLDSLFQNRTWRGLTKEDGL